MQPRPSKLPPSPPAADPLSSPKSLQAGSTTASSSNPNTQPLSPRAAEKRPQRDINVDLEAGEPRAYSHNLFLQSPEPVVLPQIPIRPSRLHRRSILNPFSRQLPFPSPPLKTVRPSSSRLLNPINHVPRQAPVPITRSPVAGTFPEAGAALLTLPEQRRSRRQSPHSLAVEHSPHDETESGRTSIGLPPSQRRGSGMDPGNNAAVEMLEMERKEVTNRPPDRNTTNVNTSFFKSHRQDRDVEANLPQSQSMLGWKYGMGNEDLPAHPPRHTRSQPSLRGAFSIKSEGRESRAGQEDGQGDQGAVAEELSWGPAHPCFPHQNPHVPLNSPDYAATKIIRVKRDWMVRGDVAPTYSNLYPEILDPLLPEHQFRNIIQKINQTLVMVFNPFSRRNWVDSVVGVLTGWLWEDLGFAGVKRRLRNLEDWLAEWNREVGSAEGVKIIPLRRTGYMSLDIQIPDPQIRVVNDDSGLEREAQHEAVKKGAED